MRLNVVAHDDQPTRANGVVAPSSSIAVRGDVLVGLMLQQLRGRLEHPSRLDGAPH